jgi:hypothetical protein
MAVGFTNAVWYPATAVWYPATAVPKNNNNNKAKLRPALYLRTNAGKNSIQSKNPG